MACTLSGAAAESGGMRLLTLGPDRYETSSDWLQTRVSHLAAVPAPPGVHHCIMPCVQGRSEKEEELLCATVRKHGLLHESSAHDVLREAGDEELEGD